MKKISKIFAMALIALSVFCLASCGGNSGGGKTEWRCYRNQLLAW